MTKNDNNGGRKNFKDIGIIVLGYVPILFIYDGFRSLLPNFDAYMSLGIGFVILYVLYYLGFKK